MALQQIIAAVLPVIDASTELRDAGASLQQAIDSLPEAGATYDLCATSTIRSLCPLLERCCVDYQACVWAAAAPAVGEREPVVGWGGGWQWEARPFAEGAPCVGVAVEHQRLVGLDVALRGQRGMRGAAWR